MRAALNAHAQYGVGLRNYDISFFDAYLEHSDGTHYQLGQPTGLLPDCCQLVWRDKQLQDSTVAHRRDDTLQSRVVLLERSGALLEVYGVYTHPIFGGTNVLT